MEFDIATPKMDDADALTDLWVALAQGQHDYGSYLAAEDNHSPIYESICQHIVTGGILVARSCDGDLNNDGGLDNDRDLNFDSDSEWSSDRGQSDIAGFVMFADKKGRYTEVISIGIIENLYVVPDQRGKGIGSALLVAAEDALKSDGVAVTTLEVMAANEAARRFYTRHGYDAHRITMAKQERETDTHSKDEG
jgi:ribosomal protein S18 acetylase RimI-like enzyme